jgi:hypothetical protein
MGYDYRYLAARAVSITAHSNKRILSPALHLHNR